MVKKLVEWTTVKGFTLDGLIEFLQKNAEMLSGKALDLTYCMAQGEDIDSVPEESVENSVTPVEDAEFHPHPDFEKSMAMAVPGTDKTLQEYDKKALWDEIISPVVGLNNKTIACKVDQSYNDFLIVLSGYLYDFYFSDETGGFCYTDAEYKELFADYIRKCNITLPSTMDGAYMDALTKPVSTKALGVYGDLQLLKQYGKREVVNTSKERVTVQSLYEQEGVKGLGFAQMDNLQPEVANDLRNYTAIILKYPELFTVETFNAGFAPFLGYGEYLDQMNAEPDFFRAKVAEIRERMLKSIK